MTSPDSIASAYGAGRADMLLEVEDRLARLFFAAERKSMHASMNLGTAAQVAAQQTESDLKRALACALDLGVSTVAFEERLAAARTRLRA